MYDAETDSFHFIAKDVPKFANRLNPCFTMFLSYPDEELVGFEIKKFSRLLHKMRALPAFAILFSENTVKFATSVDAALFGFGAADVCNEEMEDEQVTEVHQLLKSHRFEDTTLNFNSMELCET